MIAHEDAIAAARALLGTPYSEMDCINLIKKIIRTAPGGVKSYTTAGTKALWNSYTMSAKYRDLTWRGTLWETETREDTPSVSPSASHLPQEGGLGDAPRAGMLAFKRKGDDVHHVGLVTGEGTVIHSSSAKGRVVETTLTASEGWNLLGVHRYIGTSSVVSADTFPKGEGLGSGGAGGAEPLPYTDAEDGNPSAACGDSSLCTREPDVGCGDAPEVFIVDSAGNVFRPAGEWRVYYGSVD